MADTGRCAACVLFCIVNSQDTASRALARLYQGSTSRTEQKLHLSTQVFGLTRNVGYHDKANYRPWAAHAETAGLVGRSWCRLARS
eukprot:COSAG02_NODE_8815_length_2434_cov_2.682227_2_plen_86_part_00